MFNKQKLDFGGNKLTPNAGDIIGQHLMALKDLETLVYVKLSLFWSKHW